MKNMNIFFHEVRMTVFGGSLGQKQVDGINAILAACDALGEFDQEERAYILATAYHESAHTFEGIEEYGHGHGHDYGKPDPVTGKTYFGRGLVQLTWKYNYEKMGKLLGIDLVNHPEIALQLDVACKVLVIGMMRGLFSPAAGPLSKYLGAGEDWIDARRTVNGTDRAAAIADVAKKIDAAMEKAEGKTHDPKDTATVAQQVNIVVPVQVSPVEPAQPATVKIDTTTSTPTVVVTAPDSKPVTVSLSPAEKSPVLNHSATAPTVATGGLIAGALGAAQFHMSWDWIAVIAVVVAIVGAIGIITIQAKSKG